MEGMGNEGWKEWIAGWRKKGRNRWMEEGRKEWIDGCRK